MVDEAVDAGGEVTRRRRLMAVMVNLLGGPGAGHMVLGRYRRGALWAVTPWALAVPAYLLAGAWTICIWVMVLPLAMLESALLRPAPSGVPSKGRAGALCLLLIAWAMVAGGLTKAFFFEAFKIPSGTMAPTLLVGDHVFARKVALSVGRGDVIVFRYSKEPSKMFIKRVVAVGGDAIAVEKNKIVLNGKYVDRREMAEPYLYSDSDDDEARGEVVKCGLFEETLDGATYQVIQDPRSPPFDLPTMKVPAGHLFVMGDNRDNSLDSRYFGTVPMEDFVGRADEIWWSSGHEGVRWDRITKPIN